MTGNKKITPKFMGVNDGHSCIVESVAVLYTILSKFPIAKIFPAGI